MLDHIILTVSSVERSLAFYEATHPPIRSYPETGFEEVGRFGTGKSAGRT